MIRNEDYDINIDTDEILYLMGAWDVEDCMDSTPSFRISESSSLRYQSNYPDTPTYMEALSGDHL